VSVFTKNFHEKSCLQAEILIFLWKKPFSFQQDSQFTLKNNNCIDLMLVDLATLTRTQQQTLSLNFPIDWRD
jgi:hypothetical protein